jgi:hypothetical protein
MVEARGDVRIIGLKERGWMDFQDVLTSVTNAGLDALTGEFLFPSNCSRSR